MNQPAPDTWKGWMENECTQFFLRSLILRMSDIERTWFTMSGEPDVRAAQASYLAMDAICRNLSALSRITMDDIRAAALAD